MEDDDIEAYFSRTELTPLQRTTITDKTVLWREIRTIRKRGYAESKGEIFTGGGALAAPLKDFSGKTVAVMDILTPEIAIPLSTENAASHCCLTERAAALSGWAIDQRSVARPLHARLRIFVRCCA